MMRMSRLMIFLPIALLLVFPVHATPPTHLTGTIKILTSVVTVTRTADGNTFYSQAFTGSIAGGIEGNIVGTRFVIVHPTGNFTASGESTFTGTVNGNEPGTASFHFTSEGIQLPDGEIGRGPFEIGNGTGGLAGIHGEGTEQFSPSSFAYSVLVHFDPA